MSFLRHDRRRRFRPTRGFTLVELITAASLMTLMMLGVVQIFAIITETASQAQGNAYAMEQGRALLDAIHRDIRGFDRSGYFKIRRSDTNETGGAETLHADPIVPTARPNPGIPIMSSANITWYSTDCLALTSVNYWEGIYGHTTNPRRTTGAEVVYTANVKTPDIRFKVGLSAQTVDPRRGLVARGAWLVDSASAGDGSDTSDASKAVVMADLASGKTDDRLKLPDGKDLATLAVSPIKVTPLSTAAGWQSVSGNNVWQIQRVAACCTSEFLIESLDTPDTGAGSATKWSRNEYTVTPIPPGVTTGINKACPQAIRVTVAIHDPSDKKPSTGPSRRYEGFALQEVFWISDP